MSAVRIEHGGQRFIVHRSLNFAVRNVRLADFLPTFEGGSNPGLFKQRVFLRPAFRIEITPDNLLEECEEPDSCGANYAPRLHRNITRQSRDSLLYGAKIILNVAEPTPLASAVGIVGGFIRFKLQRERRATQPQNQRQIRRHILAVVLDRVAVNLHPHSRSAASSRFIVIFVVLLNPHQKPFNLHGHQQQRGQSRFLRFILRVMPFEETEREIEQIRSCGIQHRFALRVNRAKPIVQLRRSHRYRQPLPLQLQRQLLARVLKRFRCGFICASIRSLRHRQSGRLDGGCGNRESLTLVNKRRIKLRE